MQHSHPLKQSDLKGEDQTSYVNDPRKQRKQVPVHNMSDFWSGLAGV